MTKASEHVWPEGHWDWPVKLPCKHSVKRVNLIVGGQVAMDDDGNVLYPGDVAKQTELAIAIVA